jgi:hypothetical protein
MINPQRIIGFPVKSEEGGGGWMMCLNGYHGSLYLITSDGMYVTDLSGDRRTTPGIGARYPTAEQGMIVDDISFGEEHFWPAIDQHEDGTIYLTAGHPSSNIFEVLGLDTIKRIGPWTVEVSARDLAGKDDVLVVPSVTVGQKDMTVTIPDDGPTVDGNLADWKGATWVTIDDRLNMRGAVQVADGMLYAAWETHDPQLLNNNAPDGWKYVFATDGGLDLMIRTAASTDKPRRGKHYQLDQTASQGDIRLFVTRQGNAANAPVLAVRFQQVGGEGEAVDYTSPVGEVYFDSVRKVSDEVTLSQQAGSYELAVPLRTLGLNAKAGTETLGDIGVVISDGSEARRRVYWNNKAATMTSDIPSEARLTPQDWGLWRFEKQ